MPRGGKLIEVSIGTRYGIVRVIGEAGFKWVGESGARRRYVRALCDCGSEFVIPLNALRSGNTKSCGCWSSIRKRLPRTHGFASRSGRSPELIVWENIKRRCNNQNNLSYKNYGGRGIKLDPRWNDFLVFLADMGHRPHPDLTVERRDNDGPYSPENCYWATRTQQNINKRDTVLVEFHGMVATASEWVSLLDMPYTTFKWRLARWGLEDVFNRPIVRGRF